MLQQRRTFTLDGLGEQRVVQVLVRDHNHEEDLARAAGRRPGEQLSADLYHDSHARFAFAAVRPPKPLPPLPTILKQKQQQKNSKSKAKSQSLSAPSSYDIAMTKTRRGSLQAIFVPSFSFLSPTSPPEAPLPPSPKTAQTMGSRMRSLSSVGGLPSPPPSASPIPPATTEVQQTTTTVLPALAALDPTPSELSFPHSFSPPRSSPPPAFLLDDDPFANLSAAPVVSRPPSSVVRMPDLPRSPLNEHDMHYVPPSTSSTPPQSPPPPPPPAPLSPSLYQPHQHQTHLPPTPPPLPRPPAGRTSSRPAYQRPAFSSRPSLPSLDTLARMNVVLSRKVRKGRVGAGLPFEPWDIRSEDEDVGGPWTAGFGARGSLPDTKLLSPSSPTASRPTSPSLLNTKAPTPTSSPPLSIVVPPMVRQVQKPQPLLPSQILALGSVVEDLGMQMQMRVGEEEEPFDLERPPQSVFVADLEGDAQEEDEEEGYFGDELLDRYLRRSTEWFNEDETPSLASFPADLREAASTPTTAPVELDYQEESSLFGFGEGTSTSRSSASGSRVFSSSSPSFSSSFSSSFSLSRSFSSASTSYSSLSDEAEEEGVTMLRRSDHGAGIRWEEDEGRVNILAPTTTTTMANSSSYAHRPPTSEAAAQAQRAAFTSHLPTSPRPDRGRRRGGGGGGSDEEDGDEERKRRRAVDKLRLADVAIKASSSSSSEDEEDDYGVPTGVPPPFSPSTSASLSPADRTRPGVRPPASQVNGKVKTRRGGFPLSNGSSRYASSDEDDEEEEEEEEEEEDEDDDIPLAQRIPGALTAQKSMRRQLRVEREQRKQERARQLTPKPAIAIDLGGSSSHDAALLAAAAPSRQRTLTLPAKSPASPGFNPHDLARKLQHVQLADVGVAAYQPLHLQPPSSVAVPRSPAATAGGPTSPIYPSLPSSPTARSRSVRDASTSTSTSTRQQQQHQARPSTSSSTTTATATATTNIIATATTNATKTTGQGLRAARSFHRPSSDRRTPINSVGMDDAADQSQSQRLGRSSTTITRPSTSTGTGTTTSTSARTSNSNEVYTRRRSPSLPRASGERARRSDEPVPPLPLPLSLSLPPSLPVMSSSSNRPSVDEQRKMSMKVHSRKPSVEISERPPRTSTSTSQQQAQQPQQQPASMLVSQQRIFVGNMQQFHMVEIGPTTTGGDVVSLLDAQGALNWEGSGGWMVFEVAQDFGMERPVRSFELLADVQASWLKDKTVNLFVVKLTPLVGALHRNAIPTSSPTHSGYVEWEVKRGKWSKRWLHLREHGLWLSKRDNRKDEIQLCSLSNFDAYEITRHHRAPKPYAFAIKSTDNLSFFENTADYLHSFACAEREGRVWVEKILVARSYVLHQERNVLFNPKAPAPTTNVNSNSSAGANGNTLNTNTAKQHSTSMSTSSQPQSQSQSQPQVQTQAQALARSSTRKYAAKPAQPLITLQRHVFEPGSLLANNG